MIEKRTSIFKPKADVIKSFAYMAIMYECVQVGINSEASYLAVLKWLVVPTGLYRRFASEQTAPREKTPPIGIAMDWVNLSLSR